MKLTVLGSGTVTPTLERAGSGYYLQTGEGWSAMFDLGPGTLRAAIRAGLAPHTWDRLVLTHIHPDHTADLVPLLFAYNYAPPPWKRERPLQIVGPTGIEAFFERLCSPWPWMAAKDFEFEFVELGQQDWGPLRAFRVEHSDLQARAYRLEADGKVFCYSGDTRPCPGLTEACHQADLFLCECSLPAGYPQVGDHMESTQVGRLATQAQIGRVLLTHIYPLPESIDLVAEVAAEFSGPVELARDGGIYDI